MLALVVLVGKTIATFIFLAFATAVPLSLYCINIVLIILARLAFTEVHVNLKKFRIFNRYKHNLVNASRY